MSQIKYNNFQNNVLSSKWVGAGDLKPGELLKEADGGTGTVLNVLTVQQTKTMYNLTVETAHTFYVGDKGWLVHNAAGVSICPRELLNHILTAAVKSDGSIAGGHTFGALDQLRLEMSLPESALTIATNSRGVEIATLDLGNGVLRPKSIIPNDLVMKITDLVSKRKFSPSTSTEISAFGYKWNVMPGIGGGSPTVYPTARLGR